MRRATSRRTVLVYAASICTLAAVPRAALSSTAVLVLVPLNTSVSPAVGRVSSLQLAAELQ